MQCMLARVPTQFLMLQMVSKDKDFRYMATSDLLSELNNPNFRTDPETERRIMELVLKQLDDASGDISALAVKWCASHLSHNNLCL
jgi:cullin-associated NEDD8-dissociated protein 1